MRAEQGVLLVPGDHFGLPNHIRFGFGEELRYFQEALVETERGLKRAFTD
jgi:aspartate/methionine/tyrosine aminotransferase